MSSSESSPLVQDIAARLALQLGLPQPNSLLASRVISIATSTPTEAAFIKAAKGFGRFSDDFLADIRDKIRSEKGDNANGAPTSVGIVSRADVDSGIKITEGERLAPEKPIRAGLNVMDNAEVSATHNLPDRTSNLILTVSFPRTETRLPSYQRLKLTLIISRAGSSGRGEAR